MAEHPSLSGSVSRPPGPALAPFVDVLWASGGAEPPGGCRRELMLPAESLHLVLRLGEAPLRIFRDPDDGAGFTVSTAVVGGLRTGPYLRDVSRQLPSVGAILRPGAAGLLLGAPAAAFSGAHTPLADVWGDSALDRLRDRLSGAASLARRLDLFEEALAARLPNLRHIDPRIAQALGDFAVARPVGEVVRRLDTSHRHFTRLFRDAVGLSPKTWCRLARFGRVLDRLGAEPGIGWAELAAAEGYADQAHLSREFRAFAGLSPADYRRRAPWSPRHVPL
ncbi:MAG: AraC family transcriptional regulator [Kiloniellaceae bacterium]